jgi:hypothetical protein
MTSLEIHREKYELFRKDSRNEDNSIPTRIEATFEACFHIIEACMAKNGLHIQRHQKVRPMIIDNENVFEEDSESVWRAFQELENQIRPGQVYGGRINGPQLERAQHLMNSIEKICNTVLRNP